MISRILGALLGPHIVNLAGSALGWMRRYPVWALCVALALLSAWFWIGRDRARDQAEDRRAQAAAWHSRFVAQKGEMRKLVALVRAARVEAARLDQANITRVQTAWANHLVEVQHDFQNDLARARAAVADRLRERERSGPRANSAAGCGAGTGLSCLPTLSTGPLRPGEAAIVDGADIDAATVNTVTLEHLIDAWKRAASIEVSAPR